MNDISSPDLKNFLNFSIILKNEAVEISPVMSMDRALVFYKYSNRNGTYIADDFAEKLLATIPYTPIKGIFSNSKNDFTDHGQARDIGQIYGIVSATPNIAWEDHEDSDGVIRTYAAVDVLLYTAIYKEAEQITGKSLSMELYPPSLKGSFSFIEGRRQFVYTDGCFLGLQVLGDNVEPCFEGAGFYSLYSDLKNLLNELKSYTLKTENKLIGEEKNKMSKINFKLSDRQKFMTIWNLININYNENGDWTIDYSVDEVYDEYALCYNYEENQHYRFYYFKDDDKDIVTLGEKKKCYIIEVTESEREALNALKAIREFERIDEYVNNLNERVNSFTATESNLNTTIKELNQSIVEKDNTINSLNETITATTKDLNTLKENYSTIEKEKQFLENYKLDKETNEKNEVISKYAGLLPEDVINSYKTNIANFSDIELEEKLAYEYVKTNTSLFTSNRNKTGYTASNNAPLTGIEAILSKYEN